MVYPRQRLGSRFGIGYHGIDPFGVPISSLKANFLFAFTREEPALRQRLRQVEFRELWRPKPRIWSMNEWELNASSQSAGQCCGGCLLHRQSLRARSLALGGPINS